ncbi:MAG: diaminopimelate epimerase [Defluviitaleaceae bacterium]|nr:diaminopimelate epimerase [Defluviitaleaceae bacterium]
MGKKLHFAKMHGCGNDYIYFNCFNQVIDSPGPLSMQLSNRYTGIGGDGIVMILPSSIADGRMRMFNSLDGSESGMCGNAIRCVAKYLYDNGIVPKQHMRIETESGIKELFLTVNEGKTTAVRVNMGPAKLQPGDVPVDLTGDAIIARPVTIGSAKYKITCVSMGNPHAVVFTSGMGVLGSDELTAVDLETVGPLFEHSPLFPSRVNVEFAHVIGRNHIRARVWERGSGETWGCGTGACATAVAAVLNGYGDKDTDIIIEMPGGQLIIEYTDQAVYMTGDCVEVFQGIVEV